MSTNPQVGDRVAVDDPALAQLADIMRRAGVDPEPNNEGVVNRVLDDGTLLIYFDDGGSAPYSPFETRVLSRARDTEA